MDAWVQYHIKRQSMVPAILFTVNTGAKHVQQQRNGNSQLREREGYANVIRHAGHAPLNTSCLEYWTTYDIKQYTQKQKQQKTHLRHDIRNVYVDTFSVHHLLKSLVQRRCTPPLFHPAGF